MGLKKTGAYSIPYQVQVVPVVVQALSTKQNRGTAFHSTKAMNSVAYQKHCVVSPIGTSVVAGSVFSALDVVQGMRFSPQRLCMNIGAIYVYNILQCPMEAIQNRQSSLHNGAAAGILGYIGVSRGVLGIPFVDPYSVYMRYPQVSPPMLGAAVYGGLGFLLASVLGGKPM